MLCWISTEDKQGQQCFVDALDRIVNNLIERVDVVLARYGCVPDPSSRVQ
jgi:hypothetical protein